MTHSKDAGDHPHTHGPGCGHVAVRHRDHVDYLQGGRMQHVGDGGVSEHVIAVDTEHPDGHTREVSCPGTHKHGDGCGHPAVPHGDHVDYLVDGRLHYPHAGHCDDHGPLDLA